MNSSEFFCHLNYLNFLSDWDLINNLTIYFSQYKPQYKKNEQYLQWILT